jgi:bifunctional NMN adenylyltransferase/nudix hydrolase
MNNISNTLRGGVNLEKESPKSRSDYNYDFLVFIGRFQPFHQGHKTVVDEAIARARHIIILIGSAREARSIRNPFTWEERAKMIIESYPEDIRSRIHCTPLLDLPYAEQSWIRNVQMSVQGIVCQYQLTGKPRIGLIGYAKDNTSYYLKMFPQWGNIDVDRIHAIDATNIRGDFFRLDGQFSIEKFVQFGATEASASWLASFFGTDTYKLLQSEQKIIDQYRASWKQTPWKPTFVTVDAVVVQSGHILLVKRRSSPGKGLWALPGGFLDAEETLEEGALRELREETRITVPLPVLRGSIKSKEIFDAPFRSARGRTITTAFLIELQGDEKGLPRIKGSDDAEKAKWVPIADIESDSLFEDHFHIIQTMLRDTLS